MDEPKDPLEAYQILGVPIKVTPLGIPADPLPFTFINLADAPRLTDEERKAAQAEIKMLLDRLDSNKHIPPAHPEEL